MTAAFTKATGIPVKLDDNSAGLLLTQIEASRNNLNRGCCGWTAPPLSPAGTARTPGDQGSPSADLQL
jgi:hypothetical protein